MPKWADYLISAVRHNRTGTHIDKVRVHTDDGDSIGAGSEVERSSVVRSLDQGYSYLTIVKGNDGQFRRGAQVRKIIVGQQAFLRTDSDRTAADNLGSLPRF